MIGPSISPGLCPGSARRCEHPGQSPGLERVAPVRTVVRRVAVAPKGHSSDDRRVPLRGDRYAVVQPALTDGFTLIETMLAVLLMALLASAVALTFSRPLQRARAEDAADLVVAFDAAARQAAVAGGRPVRLRLDLADATLERYEGDATLRAHAQLPTGCRLDRVRVGRRTQSAGAADVDVSAHGWGRSYDVHLTGPNLDRWVCFAGLTGLATEVTDDRALPTPPPTPGYDAD